MWGESAAVPSLTFTQPRRNANDKQAAASTPQMLLTCVINLNVNRCAVYLSVAETSIVAAVGDGSLHVFEQVAHVRLVQRHVLVQRFERGRLLGRLGRDSRVCDGDSSSSSIERSASVHDCGSRNQDRRGMISRHGGRRLADGGRVRQIQTDLGRRRQQRNERADGQDVDEERHDDTSPDERPSSEQPQRHRATERLPCSKKPHRAQRRRPPSLVTASQQQQHSDTVCPVTHHQNTIARPAISFSSQGKSSRSKVTIN